MKKFLISSIIAAMAISPFIELSKANKKEITFEINSNEVGQKLEDKGNLGKRAGVYNGQFDIPGLGGAGNNNDGNGGSDGNGDDDNGGNSGGWTIPDGTDLGETVFNPLIGQIGNGSNDDNGEGGDDGDNSGEWFKPDDITIGIHDDDPINTQIGEGDNSGETIGGGFTLGPNTEGPGTSGTGSLTTYHDSNSCGYDPFTPVRVGASGVLEGTLTTGHNDYSADWFLFTVNIRSKLSVEFLQRPNNYYLFEIYEFNETPKLIYSLEDDDRSCALLEADVGSYYIKVFCMNSYYATQDQYSIAYVTSYVEEETSISWLSEDTKMLVWESDSIPKNINHWDSNTYPFYEGFELEFCGLSDDPLQSGYLDPLYRRADASADTDAIFLDSVMYIWDENDLFAYGNFLNDLIDGLVKAIEGEEEKTLSIKSVKYTFDKSVAILSFIAACGGKYTPIAISIGLSAIGLISLIFDGLISSISAFKTAILINNLTVLKDNCFDAKEDHKAVAIPRYAKLVSCRCPTPFGPYHVWWKTGFFFQHTASTPNGVKYYIVEKDSIISTFRNRKYNDRLESGTFSEYSSLDDFISQTGYSYPSPEQMIPYN